MENLCVIKCDDVVIGTSTFPEIEEVDGFTDIFIDAMLLDGKLFDSCFDDQETQIKPFSLYFKRNDGESEVNVNNLWLDSFRYTNNDEDLVLLADVELDQNNP